jgi:tetratricopeptide (TPR) repeat protein
LAAASVWLGACSTVAPAPTLSNEAYADFLVGRVANLTDDYDAASDRYLAALARDPSNQDLVDGAVVAALATGDAQRARGAARHAQGADAPAYARLLRAADGMVASRWRDAESELRAANGRAAEQLAVRVMQIWARAGQGRVADVEADIRPLLSVRSYGALLSYQQAMALDCVGRNDEALRAYAAAANGGLWLPPALERHADLLARTGARSQAGELLVASSQDDPALNAAAARLEAGQAVAASPLTPARGAAIGLYGLAAIYLEESDARDGLALLSLTLVLDPSFDQARLLFAQGQADQRHVDRALATLNEVGPQSAYAPSAHVMAAWLLLDQGRGDDAVALLRADAAVGELRAKRALGAVYRSLRRYSEAGSLYTELIGANPDDWRLYFARGAIRAQMGEEEAGEADLQHALRLAPDQPDVLNYLGYSWVDRGEHLSEGLAMIQRAVALRPDSGAIVDSLGWAYYRLHDYQRALEHMERAVELMPADPTLNDHLGDVYWRLGRRIEARYQWRRALSEGPEDAAAVQNKIDNGLPPEHPARNARR